MVSVLGNGLMATTSAGPEQRVVSLDELAELLDSAQRHEKEGAYFLAAECYQEAGEYQKALGLYVKNIHEREFRRAIEDAEFETLSDILKGEVDRSKLEERGGRPYFTTQDEVRSYEFAAVCAKKLCDFELFKHYANFAINLCLKRVNYKGFEIYHQTLADLFEQLGDFELAARHKELFARACAAYGL